MRGEQGPLLGGEVLDRVAHRRIVAVALRRALARDGWRRMLRLTTTIRQLEAGAKRGGRGHQLDTMATGGDDVARGAPQCSRRGSTLESLPAQGLDIAVEVAGDDRRVAPGRHGWGLGRHQVDLGSLPFQPDELRERRRRLDPLEAERTPELDRALDIGWRDLDPDVVEHQSSNETMEAPTTIAVVQVTASAVISMSSP